MRALPLFPRTPPFLFSSLPHRFSRRVSSCLLQLYYNISLIFLLFFFPFEGRLCDTPVSSPPFSCVRSAFSFFSFPFSSATAPPTLPPRDFARSSTPQAGNFLLPVFLSACPVLHPLPPRILFSMSPPSPLICFELLLLLRYKHRLFCLELFPLKTSSLFSSPPSLQVSLFLPNPLFFLSWKALKRRASLRFYCPETSLC